VSDFFDGPLPTEQEKVLHHLRVGSSVDVSKRALSHLRLPSGVHNATLEVSDQERFIQDELAFKLTAYVLADHLPPERYEAGTVVEFKQPASWWQHWKLAHSRGRLLGWVARRWPVQMLTVTEPVTLAVDLHKAYAFPEAPSMEWPHEQLGRPVRMHYLRTEFFGTESRFEVE
jgi:hypothetical protein